MAVGFGNAFESQKAERQRSMTRIGGTDGPSHQRRFPSTGLFCFPIDIFFQNH